ncbi:Lead, cadmium, zinc and mercury-transporting ATPase [Providencia rustigianii]|nr:Lead, cadmium, zinc and mercury-transporting ATPase [Providencia rustigianii]
MHSHSHKDTHNHTTSCCSGGQSCSSATTETNTNISHDSQAHEHHHEDEKNHDDEDSAHHHTHCCSSSSAANDDIEPTQTSKKRFSWIIRGMDCPSCAAKIETAVSQIREVSQAKVLFTTEKLVVDADSDISAAVRTTVEAAGYELHDVGSNNASSVQPQSLLSEAKPVIILAILMALSWGLEFVNPQLGNIAFILTTLFGLYPIARKSLRLMRTGSPFAIETLMTVAAVGAIFIQATEEAAMVILLFMLGEMLEAYSAGRARRGVSALMALVPEDAILIKNGQKTTVPVAQLRPGDVIEIAPGGRLPTDAVLVSGFASFDESALTGESVP